MYNGGVRRHGKGKALFESKIVVYADGGSRGNPGPAAIGVVVGTREYGEYLGRQTNNQAEYYALIFALKKLKQLVGKKRARETEVEIRMDSELVTKQMNGRYKIIEPELQPLFLEVWNLKIDFKRIDFVHVPRGENKGADAVVNRILDEERGAQKGKTGSS